MLKDIKPLKNGNTVQLFNIDINNYLITDKINYQKGVKEDFIGCSPLQNDQKTLWKIELHYPGIHCSVNPAKYVPKLYQQDEEIQFGDIVAFRNISTKNYLCVENFLKQKKPQDHQVFCGNQSSDQVSLFLFIISRDQDPFNPRYNKTNTKVYSDTPIVLVNVMNQTRLASHSKQYKQNNIAEFREVFGSPVKIQGCSWMIKSVSSQNMSESQVFEEQKVNPQKNIILDRKLVVIRNLQNGSALHSHIQHYKKGSKLQEVTGKEATRDNNDFWQIIINRTQEPTKNFSQKLTSSGGSFNSSLSSSGGSLSNSKNRNSAGQVSNQLSVNSQFGLIHQATNKILTHIDGIKSSSHTEGLEVCCTESARSFDEWAIEALNEDQSRLSLNEPFLIKHTKTDNYLICTHYNSAVYQQHQEVILHNQICPEALWCIESMADM